MIRLIAIVLASSLSFAAQAANRDSCVIQVLKNNTGGQQAHFVLACGSETIATHNVTPMSEQTEEQVQQLKSGYLQALKSIVGENSELTCNEFETDLFWIAICHK